MAVGVLAGTRFFSFLVVGILAVALAPAAAADEGPTGAPPAPSDGPVEPLPPLGERPDAGLNLGVLGEIGPESPSASAPVAIFSVRVRDGALVPWLPGVPLEVDYNGDLTLDGTLTVNPGNPAGACLVIDFRLPLSGGTRSWIQLLYNAIDLKLDFPHLPSSVQACSFGTESTPRVWMSTSGSSQGLTATLREGLRTTTLGIDRIPTSMDFRLDASQSGRIGIVHSASTTLRATFSISSPLVSGTIDRLPTSLNGEVRFSSTGNPSAKLSYTASAAIGYVQVAWGQSSAADYFTMTLRNLPSSLSVEPWVQRSGKVLQSVQLKQTASAAYGPIYFFLRTGDVPFALSADSVPANIYNAWLTPYLGSNGYGGINLRWDASGPLVNVALETGLAPNPFGGTQQYGLLNVNSIPSYFDGTFETIGSSLTSMGIAVNANAQVGSFLFHIILGNGDLDVTANIYQIPTWVSAQLSLSGTSHIPGAPALSYRASQAGLDLDVEIEGFDMGGGRLYVYAKDAPRAFDVWITGGGSDDLGQLDVSNQGTERITEFYVDAHVPTVLNGQAADHFKIDLKSTARLTLRLKDFWSCPFRACIEFSNMDTGDFWWWNAPPTVWNITVNLTFKVQQWEYCWWIVTNCWVDKYNHGNWYNGFAYYPGQYGLDGRPARAVGSNF